MGPGKAYCYATARAVNSFHKLFAPLSGLGPYRLARGFLRAHHPDTAPQRGVWGWWLFTARALWSRAYSREPFFRGMRAVAGASDCPSLAGFPPRSPATPRSCSVIFSPPCLFLLFFFLFAVFPCSGAGERGSPPFFRRGLQDQHPFSPLAGACMTGCDSSTHSERVTTSPPRAAWASIAAIDLGGDGWGSPNWNYERFKRSSSIIHYWSWNYRGCWHQTCPPIATRRGV